MHRVARTAIGTLLLLLRSVGIVLFLDLSTTADVMAQAPPADPSPQQQRSGPESTPALPPAQAPVSRTQATDDKSSRQIVEDVAKLRADMDTINKILVYGGGFLALIVAVLTIQSSVLAWMSDRRTAASHALGIKGETATQQRAETIHDKFLEESYRTIGLVNATLQLAKDATQSATKVYEERASINLKQLDEKAKGLLSDITIERARDLVRDIRQQEAIKSLAQEITLFESNRLFFADKFPLTPHCRFIRGVYSHMTQDFDDAIKEWEAIRIDSTSSKLLLGLASYWIAIEYDSLGNFDKAISTFESARSYADGIAKFDIERLIIESTFSKLPIEQADSLIKPLDSLLAEANKESESRARTYVVRRVNIALGNILLQAGKHQKSVDSDIAAEEYFRRSAEKFQTNAEEEQWALLGLAEALYYMGEIDEARTRFRKAKENAEMEFRRRMERRSQVLAKTAELMCCARVPEFEGSIGPVYETLSKTLIEIHPRLFVYSAFQKRYVSGEAFERQLKNFMLDQKLGLDQPVRSEA